MKRGKSLGLLTGLAASLTPCVAVNGNPEQVVGAGRDNVRAVVAQMLADSHRRSSLLMGGPSAGHDGEFFLASPDGDFRLDIEGVLQLRYIAAVVVGDNGVSNKFDDFETGFQTRRIKLEFDGHAFSPNLFFKITTEFDRDGGTLVLDEDAWIGHRFDNGVTVRVGQFKLPLLREELMHSEMQLAVERSITNAVFTQDISQGVELRYRRPGWRAFAAFSDGLGSANTDLGDSPADYALTGRLEARIGGSWGQFDRDFSSPRGADKFAMMIGGAIHFEQSPDRPNNNLKVQELFEWTVDASLEGDGWNMFAALIGRHTHDTLVSTLGPGGMVTTTSDGSRDEFGAVVQGGFFLTEHIEPFIRWDVIIPDSGSGSADNAFNTVTFGANYYLHGHAAKFTLDVQWFLDDPLSNELIGTESVTGVGFLNSGSRNNEIVVRAQFQLLF